MSYSNLRGSRAMTGARRLEHLVRRTRLEAGQRSGLPCPHVKTDSLQILQCVARDNPPGGDPVYPVPALAAERRGSVSRSAMLISSTRPSGSGGCVSGGRVRPRSESGRSRELHVEDAPADRSVLLGRRCRYRSTRFAASRIWTG